MATYEWESVTLGQNAEIQKIVSAAATASQLVNTNIGLAKSGLQLGQAFLLGVLKVITNQPYSYLYSLLRPKSR